ncbi:hypothetical protein B0H14DRAFT_2602597 [Mycena olivaceomarginata]|nr:hypothetical protein B0H14DRAFT_2602597 [Mycena olivaceomarginata]
MFSRGASKLRQAFSSTAISGPLSTIFIHSTTNSSLSSFIGLPIIAKTSRMPQKTPACSTNLGVQFRRATKPRNAPFALQQLKKQQRAEILPFQDEVYITQLGHTAESLSKYAIPRFHDQLTNARVGSGQLIRAQDINA